MADVISDSLKGEENAGGAESKPRRERGTGRVWQIGRIWYIQFYCRGRQIRESSHSEKKGVAERFLRRRLGESAAGQLPGPRVERVKYEEIRDALYADYKANNRKSLMRRSDGTEYVGGVLALDDFFPGFRAVDITTDRIRAFILKRQEQGTPNSTINRSLTALRRMFNLAVQDGKLREVPHFPMQKESAPRKGFLEYEEFQRLRQELPEDLRPLLTVGFYTGMRLGEILGLKWANVSFLDAQIRLDPGSTKNDEPRTIPLTGELLEMLKILRQKASGCEFVFSRHGRPVRSFRKAWTSACTRAKLPGLLFHDLRRTGVRNLVRAGVPEGVAMKISGHRTRAIFERYNIVSGRDLADAARKLETYIAERAKGDISGQVEQVPVANQSRGTRLTQ
jgi:integrase